MGTNQLLEIVRDQQSELTDYASMRLCPRAEERLINLDSKKAQVVIGVRRSGKSVLCYQALSKSNVKYAYLNFDDERLAELKAEDLNEVLRCLYQVYGDFTHLFFDEIQNIEGWHLFVNRLLRKGLKIVLTGSNARLLSSELATHLTGRYNEIRLFPFSFEDFCRVRSVSLDDKTTRGDALQRKAFDEYLRIGGFPELANTSEEADGYVDLLVSNILNRDVVNRFRVRYKDTFIKIANHLMNNAPCEVVCQTLKTQFDFKNSHTVENYVNYLYQAFLMVQLKRYSQKSVERLRNAKCYTVDVSLMDARKDAFAKENLGWRLENVVMIELLRRFRAGYDVYYFKDRDTECDFLVCHRSTVVEAIQVSYGVDNPKTKKREIQGLLKAAAKTGCEKLTLLTAYNEGQEYTDGRRIDIIPCYKWLQSAKK